MRCECCRLVSRGIICNALASLDSCARVGVVKDGCLQYPFGFVASVGAVVFFFNPAVGEAQNTYPVSLRRPVHQC